MQKLYALAALLLSPLTILADDYATKGNGTKYTLADLAEIAESGVAHEGEGVFVLENNITITATDEFSIAGASAVKFGDQVTLTLQGDFDLDATAAGETPENRVLITRTNDEAVPAGIYVINDMVTDLYLIIKNLDFEYAQLRSFGAKGFAVENCTFRYANGKMTSAGALSLGAAGASFTVKNCTFEDNEIPAIGGGANIPCGLLVEDCTFYNNNSRNTNNPQLNLIVGGDQTVTVRNCTITGAGLEKVGGIAVSNLTMLSGENLAVIEGCEITEHRYGITGVGPLKMEIRNNTLVNNNHETNPMNGGSGISLAGYNYGLDAIISGNHIENSLWGITLIQTRDVNLGEIDNADSPGENIFLNNGNNGVQYDLYNNSSNTVYAQNNRWSVPEQTAELIETVIFHKADSESLGEVIFMPAMDPASINSIATNSALKYANGIITVVEGIESVTIFNAAGQLAGKFVAKNGCINVSHLQHGLYLAVSQGQSLKFTR